MSTLYYYKSLNTLTNRGMHILPLSSTIELWEVLTWPLESIRLTPHWCSLCGLLFYYVGAILSVQVLCGSLVTFSVSSMTTTYILFYLIPISWPHIFFAKGWSIQILFHETKNHLFFQQCLSFDSIAFH